MTIKQTLSIITLSFFASATAFADSLPERIDHFTKLFDHETAVESYDIRVLQADYPTSLIMPSAMLPQTAKYPLKDIQRLYQLSKTCSGKLPLSPLITEPLVFTRAMCKGTVLSDRWFSRSGLIHPCGGSYAARYVEQYPEKFESLKRFMHIQERPNEGHDELLTRLKHMNSEAITALLAGASMFVELDELWLKRGDRYYLYQEPVWTENAQLAGLSYRLSDDDKSCFVQRGNICWEIEDHSELLQIAMIILVVANILLCDWLVHLSLECT